MIDEKRRQVLRHHVRQVRTHLLGILDWIEAELDCAEPAEDTAPSPDISMANPARSALPADQEPLTDRHHWVLEQLRLGLRLTRKQVMARFGLSARHTKRILGSLTDRGLIEFQRAPRPGHYRLRVKASRRNQSSGRAIEGGPCDQG